MPFNGSGVYTPPAADFPAVPGTTIQSSKYNNVINDIASALTSVLVADGQRAASANLPMGGFRHTGVGAVTAAGQYARVNEVQDGSYIYGGTAGGSADALTIATSPTFSAYTTGMVLVFKSGASPNTGAATLQANGIAGPKTIQANGVALVAGDIEASKFYTALYDGTNFQLTRLSGAIGSGSSAFLDSLFRVRDNGDVTKQFAFQAANIATGQTRTETLLNRDTQQIGAADVAMLGTNYSITASVASNQLTVALKNAAGDNASVGDPITFGFRSATLTTGVPSVLSVTSSLSLLITTGSSLGTGANIPHRLWLVLFNDAGTPRLGIYNTQGFVAGLVRNIFPLTDDVLGTSLAEGGGGGAGASGTFYTDSAVTNKPYRVLGYIETTQTTAGTWASAPTKIHTWQPSEPLPGHIIQGQLSFSGELATGTTTIPDDDTIPQNTEGDQYLICTITPTSVINMVEVEGQLYTIHSAGGTMCMALFLDSIANALATSRRTAGTEGDMDYINYRERAGAGAASQTWKLRAGSGSAGTTFLNGTTGSARRYGGTINSFLSVKEIMV